MIDDLRLMIGKTGSGRGAEVSSVKSETAFVNEFGVPTRFHFALLRKSFLWSLSDLRSGLRRDGSQMGFHAGIYPLRQVAELLCVHTRRLAIGKQAKLGRVSRIDVELIELLDQNRLGIERHLGPDDLK